MYKAHIFFNNYYKEPSLSGYDGYTDLELYKDLFISIFNRKNMSDDPSIISAISDLEKIASYYEVKKEKINIAGKGLLIIEPKLDSASYSSSTQNQLFDFLQELVSKNMVTRFVFYYGSE